ncbi:kinase-like domain-containing protein [Blyttiomyces helicus]|uniref:Kinase-like domain-containing protein n=1 Tax=Blyttiomyces helicus TaxID=388810 RepID=A0A4P9WID3_9FUNG|nr:kinase-like domain-containing protein [Blyttiomyces helicus]|eukprot:RKO90880.1 kinase-like domain-containing protein [Blyttiomyces helicus]
MPLGGSSVNPVKILLKSHRTPRVSFFVSQGRIAAGSFGQVYAAVDVSTGKEVAVKRESETAPSLHLQHEAEMYRLVSGRRGFANIYFYGRLEGTYNVLVLDRLGPSLNTLIFPPDGLPIRTVAYCACEMIDRLETVHGVGLTFRDVKPDQFCLDAPLLMPHSPALPTLFLIDFGLSRPYRDAEGRHIPNRRAKKVVGRFGTARYASLSVHKGYEASRRDDLESLAYVLCEMALGILPWSGIRALTSQQGWRRIQELKEDTPTYELTATLPPQFGNFLDATRDLGFAEAPDYARLRAPFQDLFMSLGAVGPLVWSAG